MSQSQQDHQSKNEVSPAGMADPEVTLVAKRRQFSRAYKLRILAEVEQCQRGEVGALLRREGLYSSMLSKWRQKKATGKLDRPSGNQERKTKDQAKELRRLQQENARLQAKLAKAEAIIEVQKKLSALLETMKD
jgi:transposase-like protein